MGSTGESAQLSPHCGESEPGGQTVGEDLEGGSKGTFRKMPGGPGTRF